MTMLMFMLAVMLVPIAMLMVIMAHGVPRLPHTKDTPGGLESLPLYHKIPGGRPHILSQRPTRM
jgi:hypothetical protein